MTTPTRRLILAAFAAFAICLGARAASNDWMVVDIKTGEVFYHDYDFATATNTFSAPVYKTEKMAFRRIPAGLYHIQDGTAYAFIRYDYYLSIFPVTVGQHASMTNRSAKVWAAGQYIEEMQRAQHNVSWRKWRGTDLPSENDWISNVGEDFWANSEYSDCPLWELDKRVLRATHDVNYSFDFPTRAMWEVAARAMPAGDGSHKTWKWFWGETIDGVELYANTNSYYSSQKVGSRLPNDWGFYDIYGTCWEWCQDGEGAVPVSSRYAALYEHSEWPHMPDADNPDQRLICGKADFGASYSYDYWKDGSGLGIGARIAVLRYQECSAAPVMITFKNETGETLQSATEMPFGESVYAYSFDTGSYIYYKGPRPTKAGNAQYYYTFSGWDQDYAISNAVVTAVFERHVCNYAVNWVNWDGSQLISNDFDYGDLPYYPGATPTKPSTIQYDYTFTGWSPEPAAVTGETTYVAQFMQSARKYDITWLNYDGSTNATSRTPYNTTPEYAGETPTKPADVQYTYSFAGWTPELEPVTSNAAYTAVFDASPREYTISWQKWDGTELFTTNVPYGSTPVYLGATPTQPSTAQYDYTFFGWDREIEPVTEATTYRAMFTGVLRSYDITWVNYDGTVLCVTNVPYGATPAYNGATPTKSPTATTRFIFSGWTQAVVPVTGATTYTATFEERAYPVDLTTLTGTFTAIDGDKLIGATTYAVSIAADAIVTLAEMASPGLTCLGNATIVIADATTNTLNGTLRAGGPGTTLTINGNTGMLTVTGDNYSAGIGAFNSVACGSVVINGGNIVASGGGNYGTGIGAAKSAGCDGVAINGGSVVAIGAWAASGIGGNGYYGPCGNITIAATITRVEATRGGSYSPGKPINSNDNVIIADGVLRSGDDDANTWTLTPVDRSLPIDISSFNATFTALDGDKLIGTAAYPISIADGATVTLSGMSSSGLKCLGNATIVIADATANTLNGTLRAGGPGTTLTINGNTGTLTVTGDNYSAGIGAFNSVACGSVVINGGNIVASGGGNYGTGIGAAKSAGCDGVAINGGSVVAIGAWAASGIGGNGYYGPCGNITIAATITRVEATRGGAYSPGKPINSNDNVIIADGVLRSGGDDANTWILEPDVKETAVTVGGAAVGEVVRGEDGKTLSFAVAAGTVAGDVKLDIGGVDVTKGFRVTVNGTEARAVLLAPYEVPKEEGAADGIWTENGDGTVTLNVTVVPGLYYAADSAESLDALACPGASAPATGATTLTAPKPVGDKGFFKVWVSDAPIPAEP